MFDFGFCAPKFSGSFKSFAKSFHDSSDRRGDRDEGCDRDGGKTSRWEEFKSASKHGQRGDDLGDRHSRYDRWDDRDDRDEDRLCDGKWRILKEEHRDKDGEDFFSQEENGCQGDVGTVEAVSETDDDCDDLAKDVETPAPEEKDDFFCEEDGKTAEAPEEDLTPVDLPVCDLPEDEFPLDLPVCDLPEEDDIAGLPLIDLPDEASDEAEEKLADLELVDEEF